MMRRARIAGCVPFFFLLSLPWDGDSGNAVRVAVIRRHLSEHFSPYGLSFRGKTRSGKRRLGRAFIMAAVAG